MESVRPYLGPGRAGTGLNVWLVGANGCETVRSSLMTVLPSSDRCSLTNVMPRSKMLSFSISS